MPRRPAKAEAAANAIAATLEGADPGTWLPTWAQLAQTYDVSNGTISAARDILVERGLIELVPNHGARTVRRLTRNEGDHARLVNGERGFSVAMRAAGYEPWDELTWVGDVDTTDDIANRLGVPTGTTVLQRQRIHGILQDDARIPVMLSWTWVNPAMASQLPILREQSTGPGGMTERFKELGLDLHWDVSLAAKAVGDIEAGRLNLMAGVPVLDAWRRCFDQENRVLEVTRRIIDSTNYLATFTF